MKVIQSLYLIGSDISLTVFHVFLGSQQAVADPRQSKGGDQDH